MKIIKRLLIIFVLLVLSGCTVESNIVVDEYGNTKEEVKVLMPSYDISDKKDRIDSYVETAVDSFRSALDTRKYKYKIINNVNGKSGALVYNNFDNICSFVQNTVFSQYLYKKINCTENEFYYEIKSVTEHIPYCGVCNDWPALEKVDLKITLPVSAEENNADLANDNTYIWKYNETSPSNKGIYLKISKTALEEKKVEAQKIKKEEQKKEEMIKNTKTFIFLVAILILIAVVFSILYKKYKANKEY